MEQLGHLPHHTGIGHDGLDDHLIIGFALLRIVTSERHGSVVTIEDAYGPARFDDSDNFFENCEGIRNMADQRMRDDRVERGIGQIEAL